MKIFAFLILILCCGESFAQVVFDLPEEEKKAANTKVFASFHVTLGFVSPDDVNEYIQNEIDNIAPGGVFFQQGTPSISVACSFNFALIYRPKNNFQFSLPIEYGTAPKTITIDRTTLTFNMNRFSIGSFATYRFFNQADNALYAGAGLLYHNMGFKSSSASKLGPRFEFGYTTFRMRSDLEFFVLADVANGKTKDSFGSVESIDFTGFYFGTRIIF
jgi:hypothetical protein